MRAPHRTECDTLLLTKRCYAHARSRLIADAIAIRGGRVVALGTWRRLYAAVSRATRVVDLRDCVATPGLMDCHTHFFYWALGAQLIIDLSGLRSLDAVLAAMREGASQRRLDDWIVARGFDCNTWPTGTPTARDLDRMFPAVPVLVYSRDGHSAWLSTAAMRRAGIAPRTPDPPGGRYLRDSRGRPTGVAQETAVDRLPSPLHAFASRQDAPALRIIDDALEHGYRTARRHGLVGVHTMDDRASLLHLQRHRAAGRLGLRIVHAVPHAEWPHARALGLRSGFGDDWLRLGGVKIFSDGALGSQTAYMFDAYPKRRGFHGVPVVAGEALRDAVREATSAGWAAWIHAIGDCAVHEAIDAIVAAGACGCPDLPHRIEHAQCVRPADVRRMARAGIVASVQPCHLPGDIATADRHWPRARRNAYPLRRMLDAGVVLACGSDAPIESIDPRRGFFGAVRRTDFAGMPRGGWFPAQRLRAADVLDAFTRGAARSIGAPALHGTLSPGAPADLTLWADDPLRTSGDAWLGVGIRGCVIDGEVFLAD